MEDYGVAKGYIDLDISQMQNSVQRAIRELDNLDRKSALAESEFNRLQSAGNKMGGVFQQAAQKSQALAEQISQSKAKCGLYSKEIGTLNTIIEKAKEKQGELGNKINEATAKYEQSKIKVKEAAEAHGKESEEYAKAVRKSQELENGLNQLNTQYEALGIEVEQSEQSIVEFKTKLNNTEASINVMNQRLAESQNKVLLYGEAWQGAGAKMQEASQKLDSAGNTLTMGITTPIMAAGTASVKFATDAQTSFAKVSTIADNTVLSYASMEKGVTKASNDTGVAITEFNEALYQSLSAGVETGNAIGFTTDMVKLAKGGFTETAKAVDVVTTVLNAYGLSADEATSISDKLITTQNIGKTTVDELASSLGRVIPTAKSMNVDMDNVSASMAIMTKRGIATAEATTYYNSMLNELGKSGTTADKALRDMAGQGFSELIANGTPVTEVLQMLSDYAQQNGLSLADMFGSMEAGKAALSIMSDGGKEYNEVLQKMQDSAGTAQEAFEKMDATPAAKMQKELNKLKNAGIEAGTQILPVVTDAMKAIGGLAEKFSNLPAGQQKAIVKTAAFAAALGPVLKVAGGATKGIAGLTTGVGKLMEKFGKASAAKTAAEGLEGVATAATSAGASTGILSAATAALASPVGIATVAIGALAGGVYLANKADEARIARLSELTGKEKELADTIGEQYDAYTRMSEHREAALSEINVEYTRTQNLADELRTLVDENGRVKAGNEERAAFVAGQLSDALGQEITLTDGVIQNYSELCSSIDETIEKQKALAIQEALKDDYVEAMRSRSDAQKQYNDELKNVETYERKLADAKQKVIDVDEKYKDANMENKAVASEAGTAHAKASEDVEIFSGKLEKSKEALKEAEESYIGYSETIQNYEGLGAALESRDSAQIEVALAKIQEHFLTAETATKESLEKQEEAIKEKYADMKAAVEQGAPGVTQEAVDAMGQLAEQATAELNAKAEQEKAALSGMFRQCGIEAPQGMIDALADKSPETQAALLDMLDSLSKGTSLKKDELKNMFAACGIESASELANALDDKKPDVQMKALELLMQLQSAEEGKRSEIVSQLKELGIKIPDSIAEGIDENKSIVTDNCKSIGVDANNSMEQGLGFKSLIPPAVNDINAASNLIGASGNTQMGIGLMSRNLNGPQLNDINSASNSVGISGNTQMGTGLRSRNLDPPKVNDIDAESKARKARNEMQIHFDNNPLSVIVNVVKNIGGAIRGAFGFADGGIATSPAIFGEAGPEMAIPLSYSKRSRALSLYEQTGKLLGVSAEQSLLRAEAMNNAAASKSVGDIKPGESILVSVPELDYDLLSEKVAGRIAEEMRKAPIQAIVEMEDGDVYLDNEKVGRKQAPVISRIISQNA